MSNRQLASELTLFFMAKLALLALLYALFFAPSHQPTVDAQTVATTLFDQPPKDGSFR
jgi:hypothetical protein